jgi:hypothetical protein
MIMTTKTNNTRKRNTAHTSVGRVVRKTATLNDRVKRSAVIDKQWRAKHPGTVYLWITGDMDSIGKARTYEEADAFITKMVGIGYYASIIKEPTEAQKKLAVWVKT